MQKLLLQNPDCFLHALICITVSITSAVHSDALVLLHALHTLRAFLGPHVSSCTFIQQGQRTGMQKSRYQVKPNKKKTHFKIWLGIGSQNPVYHRAPLPFVLSALLPSYSLLMIFFPPTVEVLSKEIPCNPSELRLLPSPGQRGSLLQMKDKQCRSPNSWEAEVLQKSSSASVFSNKGWRNRNKEHAWHPVQDELWPKENLCQDLSLRCQQVLAAQMQFMY